MIVLCLATPSRIILIAWICSINPEGKLWLPFKQTSYFEVMGSKSNDQKQIFLTSEKTLLKKASEWMRLEIDTSLFF